MVKGISRQVIVVNSPDKQLFDQAIFILREDAIASHEVTDDVLLREAKRLLLSYKPRQNYYRIFWGGAGAITMALVWLLSSLF